MRQLNLPKSFDTVIDSGIKTLVVSGCSFTYNHSEEHRVSWPYILADRLNIPVVLDSSLAGIGNNHISKSIQWCLETQELDPATTCVAVMWSGHGREDHIIESKFIKPGQPTYNYIPGASTGSLNVTGNTGITNVTTLYTSLRGHASSAVESYTNISSLYNYLKANNYKFLFLDFMDRNLPNRSNDIIITDYLPDVLKNKINQMVPTDIENFYRWSLQRLLLCDDDFHPNVEAHQLWCDQVLVPYFIKNIL